MPAGKNDIVTAMRDQQHEIEQLAMSLPEAAWTRGVYEAGWNAKQLLCHLAENSGVAGFLLGFARAPSGASAGSGAAFDIDTWNAQRVAALEDKPIPALLEELRGNSERNIAAVEAAPGDLLAQQIKAPWGAEGTVGEIILGSIQEHGETHLADLRRAANG